MKQSEFKIFISIKSYDDKTAENYRNYYIAENRIVSKLSNVKTQNYEDLNEDCVKISRPYILYFPRYKPSKNVTVRSGQLIVLNDLAGPKNVH